MEQEYIGASEDERNVLLPIFCALLGRNRGREFLQKKASLSEFQKVAAQLISDLITANADRRKGFSPVEQPSLWARGEIQERARRRPSEWLADLEKIKARGVGELC
jgi:hypothetical protein